MEKAEEALFHFEQLWETNIFKVCLLCNGLSIILCTSPDNFDVEFGRILFTLFLFLTVMCISRWLLDMGMNIS